MDSMLEEFDDLELRNPAQDSVDDKGKRPVEDPSDSEQEEEEDQPEPASPSKGSEPGDMTCAICLGGIPLPDMAMVKGCGHIYCAKCILAWALHKETPWCPQCKQPFHYLLTYRTLDGELQDFPTEESVVLLKRARWLEDSLRVSHADALHLLEDSRAADDVAWHDYADEYDLAEDEEIEAFYYSSAAGRARIMLGNRRFGEGGYIATGRRQARPTNHRNNNNNKSGKGSSSKANRATPASNSKTEKFSAKNRAASGGSGSSRAVDIQTSNINGVRKDSLPAAAGSYGSSTSTSSSRREGGSASFLLGQSPLGGSTSGGNGNGLYGSSPAGSGRRAKRNARRAAFDASQSAATTAATTPITGFVPLSPLPPSTVNDEGEERRNDSHDESVAPSTTLVTA